MYSMAMNDVVVSESSPMSWIVTMLGWDRIPAVWASRTNRSRRSGSSSVRRATAAAVLALAQNLLGLAAGPLIAGASTPDRPTSPVVIDTERGTVLRARSIEEHRAILGGEAGGFRQAQVALVHETRRVERVAGPLSAQPRPSETPQLLACGRAADEDPGAVAELGEVVGGALQRRDARAGCFRARRHLEPVDAGQHDVEHHEVRLDALERLDHVLESLGLGAEDAQVISREFAPEFETEDLLNLPNYTVYLKMMIDGAPRGRDPP